MYVGSVFYSFSDENANKRMCRCITKRNFSIKHLKINALSFFRICCVCMCKDINVYTINYKTNTFLNNYCIILQCLCLTVYSMGLRI
jgi:hypothetical protein